jgi:STE24 endopeptidase
MINRWLICRFILFLLAAPLSLQAEDNPPTPPAAVVPARNPGSFDPAAATQAWLDTVPPDKKAKSDAYFEGGYWLILWNFLWSVAISIFLLESRISARVRDLAERTTPLQPLQVALYAIPILALTAILTLPLDFYQGFVREHAYGLSTQNFTRWFLEEFVGQMVVVVAGTTALAGVYRAFYRAPRNWWPIATGTAVVFFVIGAILAPVFVAPLFNKYQTVTDSKIREPILALARANEIPVDQVYEFDASRQTTKISANVSGFLNTTRISLNDNLLKRCSLPEIRCVMSHEMGHYVLNHNAKTVRDFAIFIFVAFGVIKVFFDPVLRKWGSRWGVRGIADPAGYPILLLIFSTFVFVFTPLINTVTRNLEREADAFGLNASRESDGMARAALKLGAYRKLNPRPIEEVIFFDHPSGRARIRMAMDWKSAQLPCGDVNPP